MNRDTQWDYFDGSEAMDAELIYDEALEADVPECTVKTADEALIACLNRWGCVDLAYMQQISNMDIQQLTEALEGSAIFQDPAYFDSVRDWDPLAGWVIAPRYLCGDLRGKLRLAREMEQRFPGRFRSNVSALKTRLPAQLGFEEIHISLGAPWVPADIYSDFITELLHLNKRVPVYFSTELARWRVEPTKESLHSPYNFDSFGTVELSAIKIMEATMNAKTVKVYEKKYSLGSDVERKLDLDATLLAQEKQRLLLRAFEQWLDQDERRKQRLAECYNDAFVGCAYSPYDGSFLQFPDLAPGVELFVHQRNAVARVLLSRDNVLLCHEVGSGKTYEIVVSVHELKRMGLSKKTLVTVPNNVLQDVVATHQKLYPHDRIKVIYPSDFTKKDRTRVLEEIRCEDPVAIYMAYSSFDQIKMSVSYRVRELEDRIRFLRNAAETTLRSDERRQLKAQAERLVHRLTDLLQEGEDTPWLSFDDLGIDTLVVDEAHNYKNIPYDSKADNIIGRTANSGKCKEMLAKTKVVNRVIFATGTPLTNSLADLFVMMTYLQPQELKFRGIDSFDMWINTFAQRVTDFEIDIDGTQLRLMTRFSTFRNLPELMSIFSSVCDFHKIDPKTFCLPTNRGYRDIQVPKTKAQVHYLQTLVERMENIRAGTVPVTEDNLLKVITDGRKCALHPRLVDENAQPEPGETTKLDACAREAAQIYRQYPGTCQIIFSDLGTPKACFNVFHELLGLLVDRGLPRQEIAFIHDAHSEEERAKLFQAMNEGKIRIAIGSTSKLGLGVNVQQRLKALHHLSIPWKPSDIIQREGRMLRQGNTCEEVFLYRYVTEGTFDAYSWQLLENKQQFISSLLSGLVVDRSTEDIMEAVLSYAVIKALAVGDSKLRERCQVETQLQRCRIAYRQRQKHLMELRSVVEKAPQRQKKLQSLLETVTRDQAHYARHKATEPEEERLAFGEELQLCLRENVGQKKERVYDEFQGFSVVLPGDMSRDYPYVFLTSPNGGRYPVELKVKDPMDYAKRLKELLDGLGKRRRNLQEELENSRKLLRLAHQELESEDPYEEEITRLSERLEQLDEELNRKEAA